MAEKTQKYVVTTPGLFPVGGKPEAVVGSVLELTEKQAAAFVNKVKPKVDADGEGKAFQNLEKAEARIENLLARVAELETENKALKEAAAKKA